MLEFVLMLPFIWIVLALIFSFGMAFLERQRAAVALRETAMRHAMGHAGNPDTPLATYASEVAAQNLSYRRMSAQVGLGSDAGLCARAGEGYDRTEVEEGFSTTVSGFGEVMQWFLARVSSSRSYEMTAVGQPPVAQFLSQGTHAGCFVVDGTPWTREETGGPLDWLKSAVGGLGGTLLDALF